MSLKKYPTRKSEIEHVRGDPSGRLRSNKWAKKIGNTGEVSKNRENNS